MSWLMIINANKKRACRFRQTQVSKRAINIIILIFLSHYLRISFAEIEGASVCRPVRMILRS